MYVLIKQKTVWRGDELVQYRQYSHFPKPRLPIDRPGFAPPHQVADAEYRGGLQARRRMRHVVGELFENVVVGHDVVFGALAVGNVGKYAESLFFDVRRVRAFQDEHDRLHHLRSVQVHHRVGVGSRRDEVS